MHHWSLVKQPLKHREPIHNHIAYQQKMHQTFGPSYYSWNTVTKQVLEKNTSFRDVKSLKTKFQVIPLDYSNVELVISIIEEYDHL